MRIIKFRCLGKETKKWHYYNEIDGRHNIPDEYCSESQQFTGLLDKNGKEIYEGDIVKLVNKKNSLHQCKFASCPHEKDNHPNMSGVGVVGRNTKKAGFAWNRIEDYRKKDWEPYGIFDWEGTLSIEVIGNIYENPELLK